jgi:hypothetical protein
MWRKLQLAEKVFDYVILSEAKNLSSIQVAASGGGC